MSLGVHSEAAWETQIHNQLPPCYEQILEWEKDLAVLVLHVSDYLDFPKWT